MKSIRLINSTRKIVICENCEVADNLFTRIRGLLGRTSLAPDEGLLITPCPSIHMFGMKFGLDVLFVTRDNIVTDFVENIVPGKMYNAKNHCGKPYAAIELAVGTIERTKIQRGDQLTCEDSAASL